mgnify:CR=1 FL=1
MAGGARVTPLAKPATDDEKGRSTMPTGLPNHRAVLDAGQGGAGVQGAAFFIRNGTAMREPVIRAGLEAAIFAALSGAPAMKRLDRKRSS